MIKIDKKILGGTIKKSEESYRKRAVFNLHKGPEEPIQRFINVIQPESVEKAHKHENTNEVFIVLKGKFELEEYDDEGNVVDSCIIEPNGDCAGAEIEAGKWHSIGSLEKDSAVFIVIEGPYDPKTHKIFANFEK